MAVDGERMEETNIDEPFNIEDYLGSIALCEFDDIPLENSIQERKEKQGMAANFQNMEIETDTVLKKMTEAEDIQSMTKGNEIIEPSCSTRLVEFLGKSKEAEDMQTCSNGNETMEPVSSNRVVDIINFEESESSGDDEYIEVECVLGGCLQDGQRYFLVKYVNKMTELLSEEKCINKYAEQLMVFYEKHLTFPRIT